MADSHEVGDGQLELFRKRGGKRDGAGRKRVASRATVPHRPRARVTRHTPVHVTMRLRPGLATLRSRRGYRAFLRACLPAREHLGMRIAAWSLQREHVHLIVETETASDLAVAMKGLSVRFVRAFNRLHGRSGSALGDRYHARPLADPVQARLALRYVLANARHHGAAPARGVVWLDAWSSSPWFDGWADGHALAADLRRRAGPVLAEVIARLPRSARRLVDRPGAGDAPVAPPGCWLLRVGWRDRGVLSARDAPA